MHGLFILVIGLCLFVLIGAAAGLGAWRRVRDLRDSILDLRTTVGQLQSRLAGLTSGEPAPEKAAGPAGTDIPAEAGQTPPPEESPVAARTPEADAAPAVPEFAAAATARDRDALEENITSRWFVWLGGVALALSGVFLVKYSVEHGLLGPTARVVCGVLLAVAFGLAGEWVRRKQAAFFVARANLRLIPAALSAAAVATAFGSIYAGYILYALFSSTVAFVMLVFIAAAAVLLSLVHGPYVAAIGLLGAYLVPALVSTGDRSAWRLFLYLEIVNAGGLVVLRYCAWRWLQVATLVAAAGWMLLWIAIEPAGSGVAALSAYLAILLVLIYLPYVRRGGDIGSARGPEIAPGDGFDWKFRMAGAVVTTALFVLLVIDSRQAPASLIGFGVFVVALLGIAYREKEFELLAALGAASSVLVVASWDLPAISTVVTARPGEAKVVSVDPETIRPMWMAALAFGALFGLAGHGGVWRARRPGIWAAVSAATPVLMLAVLFWRAFDLEVNVGWAAIGLALAGLASMCVFVVAKHRTRTGFDEVLAAYAVAAVAAIALAVAMALREVWLTVALAALVPAVAWINSRLAVAALRYTAAIVAGIVLVRLALNPRIFDYGPAGPFGFNWILYGYGIPTMAFYGAARLFRREADDWLVTMLEGGALLCFVLLLGFEIRHLAGDGRLDSRHYGFVEMSLHSLAWGCTALGLLRQYRKARRAVALWGYRVLGSLAIGQVVLLQCLLFNPVWTHEAVGQWPILNILLVAYMLPAVLCALAHREARCQGETAIELIAGGLALFLVFVYLTLELRHAFRGNFLDRGAMRDAELYGYSIGWLVYAGILLFLAVLRKAPALRYGSLAITLIAIGKVFLIDMASLTGLYRVGSFLALGIVLIGIGFIYQRFVFVALRPPEET